MQHSKFLGNEKPENVELSTLEVPNKEQEDTDRKACLSVTAQKNVKMTWRQQPRQLWLPPWRLLQWSSLCYSEICQYLVKDHMFWRRWNTMLQPRRDHFLYTSSTCWPHVSQVWSATIGKIPHGCLNWKNSTWVLACGKTNFFSLCCGNKCPSVVSCTLMRLMAAMVLMEATGHMCHRSWT